jgi:hypothetical protein
MSDVKPRQPKLVARLAPAEAPLPPELLEQVQAYADAHYLRQSEALRYLIAAGLGAEARAMLEQRRQDACETET